MTKENILLEQIKELEKLIELKDKRIKALEDSQVKYVPYVNPWWIQPTYPYQPFWTCTSTSTGNLDNVVSYSSSSGNQNPLL